MSRARGRAPVSAFKIRSTTVVTMHLSDKQRSLVPQIDALLNRLACDIVMGPTASAMDGVRQGFGQVARLLRDFDDPRLANLIRFVEGRLSGLDADLLAPFHQAVCQDWGKFYGRLEGEALASDAVAEVEPARAELGASALGALDFLADVAPSSQSTPIAAAPLTAAADDSDLIVLASDSEMAGMFVAEALDHLGAIEATLLELETSPSDKRLLDDVFRPFHTIKGNAGALGVVSVQEFAHKVENLLDLARAGQLAMGAREIEIVLEAVDVLTTMIGELPARISGRPATDTTRTRARLVAQIARATAGGAAYRFDADTTRPAQVVDFAAVEAAVSDGEAPRQRKSDTAGQSSVKIDTRKLDSLVDMIGELVIAQALIYEEPALQRSADERLQRNLAHVRRITTDLQRSAMAMRLVPVKGTFQKMARLVRDLSKRSGKPIELTLTGEDVELDRKVVEEINDPLMHMIRNSVDHGIETTDLRVAAGKRAEGRLSLSASHQGGSIVIALADDGGGLNSPKILQKAIERGLVAAGDTLSPSDVHQLIFKPGFSTADEVTEISGRGVGMDVVRRNIEALRGRIDIQSTPGQGTTFLIKLPLTLAILDGLTLATGGQRFVLPIFSVRESLRPTPQQVHHVHGAPRMIQVRDHLMPLMWLSDAFGVRDARTDATEATGVVNEDDNRSVGLVVDELVGKQEVVIKSLGETFAGVRGVAGGAILGDGRVGLIIDAGGLIDLLQSLPAQAA